LRDLCGTSLFVSYFKQPLKLKYNRTFLAAIFFGGIFVTPALLFIFVFSNHVARPHVVPWSLWVGISWAVGCFISLIVDLLPRFILFVVTTISGLVWPSILSSSDTEWPRSILGKHPKVLKLNSRYNNHLHHNSARLTLCKAFHCSVILAQISTRCFGYLDWSHCHPGNYGTSWQILAYCEQGPASSVLRSPYTIGAEDLCQNCGNQLP